MQLRRLGRSDLEIPPIVLGGMFRDPVTRKRELDRGLDCAIDSGLFAIDTAPLYDFGESEKLIGRYLKTRRARMCVMTKVGLRWDADWGDILFSANVSGMTRTVRRDSRPDAVRKDVEGSLSRLECETLDLVQVHHRDHQTPIAETMGELLRLRTEGKLRAIGVSNFSVGELVEVQDSLDDVPMASTQNDYSLIERSCEDEILPKARDLKASLLAFSPLAQGLLAGRMLDGALPVSDGRREGALFQPKNVRRLNHVLRSVAQPIANAKGCGLAEIALGWIVAQPGVGAAIVGAQNEEQVRIAAEAALLELPSSELARLDQSFSALQLDRRAGISMARRVGRRLQRLADRVLK